MPGMPQVEFVGLEHPGCLTSPAQQPGVGFGRDGEGRFDDGDARGSQLGFDRTALAGDTYRGLEFFAIQPQGDIRQDTARAGGDEIWNCIKDSNSHRQLLSSETFGGNA